MSLTETEIEALPYRECVGIVLVNTQGNVFAAQRIDNFKDAWQMPQGGIDKGEDHERAALRELEEETGVPASAVTIIAKTDDWIPYDLPKELVPKLWKGRFRGQKQKWYLMQFNGESDLINIETEVPEFSKWTWMSPSEITEKIVPFKRHIYVSVFGQFKEHLDQSAGLKGN